MQQSSLCSITGRLKSSSRQSGGKEEKRVELLFTQSGGQPSDRFTISQANYNYIQREITQSAGVTISRRDRCQAHEQDICVFISTKKRIGLFFVYLFQLTLMLVFILFPPWPPTIFKKLVYRAPPRGFSYHLIYGEEGKNTKTTFFAREAADKTNVRLCLPAMLKKSVDAVDVFYHAKRCSVNILNVEHDINICVVRLICNVTHQHLPVGHERSPYLIIFCQPNSSDLGCCLLMEPNFADIADFLWCDVLFFDYPGYGVSDGQPSEYNIYRSSEIVMEHAKTELGYPEERIILMGFSLGTSVAVHLASNYPRLGALILLAPFTSLFRVLSNRPRQETSWNFDLFRSIDKASAVSCPTLIVHGKRDRIVSLPHGQEMHAEIAGAEIIVVEKATHQTLMSQRITWDGVFEFLQRHLDIRGDFKRFLSSFLLTNGTRTSENTTR